MKKILLLLLILLTTADCKPQDAWDDPSQVQVDSVMRPYFDEFVEIAQRNNLKINWKNIQTIEAIPLARGINGLYSTESRNIYMNYFYSLPPYISEELTVEQQKRMLREAVLAILAHEIAHSQGYKHVDAELDLMAKTDKWLYWSIVNIGVEEYILLTFCNGQ